ncbi:MAG TPA: hypothetical protein VG267_05660 [Terracidiphilus sp.]|nr:hypothetical protein [Terracidiphilus sp.]
MADEKRNEGQQQEPRGFTPRTSRLASEYAREQGWDTNEEQRAQTPREKQPYDGGRDYDYGARDFGDTAEDTGSAKPGEEEVSPDGQE